MRNTKTTNILLIIIIVILLAPGLLLGLVYVSSVLNMGSGYTTSSNGVTQKLPRAAQYSTPRQVADIVDNSCRQSSATPTAPRWMSRATSSWLMSGWPPWTMMRSRGQDPERIRKT